MYSLYKMTLVPHFSVIFSSSFHVNYLVLTVILLTASLPEVFAYKVRKEMCIYFNRVIVFFSVVFQVLNTIISYLKFWCGDEEMAQ